MLRPWDCSYVRVELDCFFVEVYRSSFARSLGIELVHTTADMKFRSETQGTEPSGRPHRTVGYTGPLGSNV